MARHELRRDGQAFRLRPIALDDAPFVLALRTDERAAGRLHAVSGRLEDQVAWLDAYFERAEDWCWIVERIRDGNPEGMLGVYALDRAAGSAEWGRWILRAGSLAAPESALLVYEIAFEELALNEVHCRTVATNASVLSFHDRAGLRRLGLRPEAFDLGGVKVDAVEHQLTRERWPAVRDALGRRAEQAAQLAARSAT
jgi:RimJ/RimL family protein N-acetyltransferase